MKDKAIMKNLTDAAAAALEAGLRHARQTDPLAYTEVMDLMNSRLANPELVVQFLPELSVCFRLVGEVTEDGDAKPMTLEVFRYGGPAELPEIGLTH